MRILAIDPGPQQSAMVSYDAGRGAIMYAAIHPNAELVTNLEDIHKLSDERLAIEMIASYGMPVGAEVFETCVWIGRFLQAWHRPAERIFRKDVKLSLCHSPKANDASIRQAIIDRFGPGREVAIGTKKHPGPLYGIRADMWAALAVALTYAGKAKEQAA